MVADIGLEGVECQNESDFFFQAEDGIRARTVTGVQTCALPISRPEPPGSAAMRQPLTPLTRDRLVQLIQKMKASRVAVVGDIMLDRYLVGETERLSPEEIGRASGGTRGRGREGAGHEASARSRA